MMHSLAQTALMAPGPEVGALRTLFGELFDMPQVVHHMAELLAGSDVRYDVGDDHRLSGRLVPDLRSTTAAGSPNCCTRPSGPARSRRRARSGRGPRLGPSGGHRDRRHGRPAGGRGADSARRLYRLGNRHIRVVRRTNCVRRCSAGVDLKGQSGSVATRDSGAQRAEDRRRVVGAGRSVHLRGAGRQDRRRLRRPGRRRTANSWCAGTNRTPRSWPGRSVA